MNGSTKMAIGASAVGLAVIALRPRKRADVTADRAHVTRSVTIRRPAEELFDAFTSVTNIPYFFRFVSGVEIVDNRRQKWTFAVGSRSKTVGVEIVDLTPPARFEWCMKDGPFAASASFTLSAAPGARGTQARLAIGVTGPGSKAAAAFLRTCGASPAQISMETLRQFKALSEAGEIPKAVRD